MLFCKIPRIITYFIAGVLGVILLSGFPAGTGFCAAKQEWSHFDRLAKRLAQDGFNEKQMRKLFHRSEVHFETGGIARFSVHKEARLNYNQFLSRSNIRKARRYLRQYKDPLAAAEKKYGVEREIITAVMLVETKLGTYLGGRTTLNILSTMAALKDPQSRDYIWNRIAKVRARKRSRFDKWSDRKASWAYQELKAFLTYAQREGIDPVSIQGSYAGAIGICQFMPSNVLKLAKDGNGDGRVDLFDHADAIASIANFLKSHGWRKGLDRKRCYKILLNYNYSKPYANILLDIAGKLKG